MQNKQEYNPRDPEKSRNSFFFFDKISAHWTRVQIDRIELFGATNEMYLCKLNKKMRKRPDYGKFKPNVFRRDHPPA